MQLFRKNMIDIDGVLEPDSEVTRKYPKTTVVNKDGKYESFYLTKSVALGIGSLYYIIPFTMLLVYGLFVSLLPDTPETLAVAYWWGRVGVSFVVLIVMYSILKSFKGVFFKRSVLTHQDKFFLSWFTPTLIMVPNMLLQLSRSLGGATTTQNQTIISNMVDTKPIIVVFILTVLIAPFVEEFVFRGLMLFSSKNSRVSYFRVVLSGIVFSAIHGPTDIVSFLVYFTLGAGLAYAVKRTNRLESSIMIHFVNNFLTFLLLFMF